MSKGQGIGALCRRHHNEDMHTEHVTGLALTIFDAVAGAAGLTARDRALLELAGRLHDIGYARAPTDHVQTGAGIIERSRIRGFTQAELRAAAAIMRLHSARWEEHARSGALRGAPNRATVLRLGAILRVADALDHGHIQGVAILSMRPRGRTVVMRVRAPDHDAGVDRVRAKADLWRRVMPVTLDVRRVAMPKAETPYGQILTPKHSALETARRLLWYYYRSVSVHARLALVEDDPIHLHDIRVGLRRFRSVLRLFRAELAPTSAEYINGQLRNLSRLLGPLRDADAWLELLEAQGRKRRVRADSRWAPYLERQRRAAAANLKRLRGILAGSSYRETALRMAVLVRVEIPELGRRQKARAARKVLANRLRRTVRRVTELGLFRKSLDVETMHDLRILCRRGRYWTEFAAPAMGAGTAHFARRLKGVADALGHLHDLDVALETVHDDPKVPRAVGTVLREARQQALQEAAQAWKRLHRRNVLAHARKELE